MDTAATTLLRSVSSLRLLGAIFEAAASLLAASASTSAL